MESSLSELVKRTEGLQPWRRIFHAVNGGILVLAMETLPIPTRTALLVLGTLLLALVVMDVLRLARPEVNRAFFRSFYLLASPREAGKLASSTWYVLGAITVLLLFPRETALAGILVLALADPAAGYVGRKWGKRRLGGGTMEGSAAFTLMAFAVLWVFAPWPMALVAALVTAVIEALPVPLDDNLSIPLVASGVLHLLL